MGSTVGRAGMRCVWVKSAAAVLAGGQDGAERWGAERRHTSTASDPAAEAHRMASSTLLRSPNRAATKEPRKQSPAPVVSSGRPSDVESGKKPILTSDPHILTSCGSKPFASAGASGVQSPPKCIDPAPPSVTSTCAPGLPLAAISALRIATARRTRERLGAPSRLPRSGRMMLRGGTGRVDQGPSSGPNSVGQGREEHTGWCVVG